MRLLVLSLLFVFASAEWPLPYENYPKRPARDQRCHVSQQQRFCPGEINLRRLDFDPNDEIDIYVLSTPTSDFDLTPMDSFKRIKVGLALHSRMTKRDYTITYSPFSSVLDATVPLLFPKKEMLWCNQAAVCATANFNQKEWKLKQRVGVIGGDRIDALIIWLMYFNNTKPFFETFTLKESKKTDLEGNQIWMVQFDDTRFLVQALQTLENNGASFYKNTSLHLTSPSLYCKTPQLLGTPAELQKKDPAAYEEARSFFEVLQPTNNIFTRIYHYLEFHFYVNIEGKFYYLFNEKLWKLKLVSPRMAVETLTMTV